jgi:large subunit ribosomal protein L22
MREKRLISLLLRELNNLLHLEKKRLVADLVRGQKVERALNILRFSSKEASRKLEKLVLSVIANCKKP